LYRARGIAPRLATGLASHAEPLPTAFPAAGCKAGLGVVTMLLSPASLRPSANVGTGRFARVPVPDAPWSRGQFTLGRGPVTSLGKTAKVSAMYRQIGPTDEQLGNLPQAFTHPALISAAVGLDRQLGGAPVAWR
jgi:hypothetical protein